MVGDTQQLAAAVSEHAELVAEQDARLVSVAVQLRRWLASSKLTVTELRHAAQLTEELTPLADQRLQLAAHQATGIGQIITAAIAAPPHQRVAVLRAQVAELESVTGALRVTVEILEASDELARKLR